MAGVEAESTNGRKENTKREWHGIVDKHKHKKKSATTAPFLHRSKFVVVSWRSLPQHLHFKIYFFQSQNLVMKMKTLCSR